MFSADRVGGLVVVSWLLLQAVIVNCFIQD